MASLPKSTLIFPLPAGARAALALCVTIALGACASLAPESKQPAVDTPLEWPADSPIAPITPEGGKGFARDWWTMFGDASLDRLVTEALANNRDVALAIARVDEARALAALARADRLPYLQGSAGAGRARLSERTAAQLPPGTPTIGDTRRVGIEALYEVDLWGRYRDASASARALLAASSYARDVVRLAVATQVAQGYVDLRALDLQLELTRRTLDTRNQAVALRERRLKGGTGSDLDLRQDQAEAAAAEATLAELDDRANRTEAALAILLGRSPRALFGTRLERGASIEALTTPPGVPAGLPSELLARRPDLRESQARLSAATADIGVARSSYLPSLSLTGAFGGESAALADVLTSPARVWQLAASLAAPIFTGGRARAAVDVATARERQAIARYEQIALDAFREVRDALSRRSSALARAQAQQNRITALERARRLARLRYDSGYSGYLDVLDADRNLFQSELDRVAARRDTLIASVDLIRSLGGGWEAGEVR